MWIKTHHVKLVKTNAVWTERDSVSLFNNKLRKIAQHLSRSAAESHKQNRTDWLVRIMLYKHANEGFITTILYKHANEGFITTTTRWCVWPSLDSLWPHAELSFRSTICSSLICWEQRPHYAICPPFLQTYSSKPEGVANCATGNRCSFRVDKAPLHGVAFYRLY